MVIVVWEEVEKSIPLESRGVRILTKCSRKQIGVVATPTIMKVDKRPSKHFSYIGSLMIFVNLRM